MRHLLLAALLVAMTGCEPDTKPTGVTSVKSIGMRFVPIPAGTFTMGDANGAGDETPHKVTLTKPFELGVYEVTREQWKAVMSTTPWESETHDENGEILHKHTKHVTQGDDYPATYVCWDDAVEFCRRLSELPEEKSAGHVYRLPTEAEWEYASRAGTTTMYSFGNEPSQLEDYAWYADNAKEKIHPVGQKKPNPWGLYDMHGNVTELCQDWYDDYQWEPVIDPTGPSSWPNPPELPGRVIRGGSWHSRFDSCRSANRGTTRIYSYRHSFIGFRVAASAKEDQPTTQAETVSSPETPNGSGDQSVKADVSAVNSIGMRFLPISVGTFTMGDANGDGDETPHQVTLTQPFELGVYEVTQEQYEAVMGTNPSKSTGPQRPVENVRWGHAVEFCRKLSELPAEKSAGYVYRLPTEAEWEYACRAETTTKYSSGDSESELGGYAWFRINSVRTHPVGLRKPNQWGLYDMHGNVREWCQDWHGDYQSGSVTDPTGPASGDSRALRGGCFRNHSSDVRSANRNSIQPDIRDSTFGFRPARTYNLSR